jgi:hypothetical protein
MVKQKTPNAEKCTKSKIIGNNMIIEIWIRRKTNETSWDERKSNEQVLKIYRRKNGYNETYHKTNRTFVYTRNNF